MLKTYLNTINYLEQLGGKEQKIWKTLEHNGVLLPPEYEQINIPIIYNGKEIILNKEAEEAATFYAKFLNTEYLKNQKFNKNFWKDFKKLLDPKLEINNLEDIDFTKIKNFLEKKNMEKKSISSEEKSRLKEEEKKNEEKYTIAIIDGKEQPIGNYRIEPPGIFLGRGCHPKIGSIKKRIKKEDITINIGKDSKIPEGNWKEVINDKSVIWLASWKEHITDKIKYVRLSDKSDFKSESDKNKFELARKLKKKIPEIRKINDSYLQSNNDKKIQLAIALYLIENLSIRVGNEKYEDEADTVGVISLRVEHIFLLEDNYIKLDFLGKDSVRYTNKTQIDSLVYEKLNKLIQNKSKNDDIFDNISPNDLNNYLQSFMPNLTSKVFRTMNASKLFQKELNKISLKYESNNINEKDKVNFIFDEYNKANAKVALLCNHQKNINKNLNETINKYNDKINQAKNKKLILEKKKKEYKDNNKDTISIKNKINRLEVIIKKIKSKKELKNELKNVSLGTSKINYIDPRITVSFMKKNKLDINKLFTKSLQEKFKWALDVEGFEF